MGTLEASWSVEIGAPTQRCYDIAADIEGAPEWQGTLERIEVMKRDREGRPLVVDTISDASIKKVKSRLRFSYDPPDGIAWEQEEGEVKWLTGSWEFQDAGDGRTRATYRLRSDPGRILSMLLRGPVEGKVKELLTKGAAEGLKKEAEGRA
jgi:uncharacterized membrane protein